MTVRSARVAGATLAWREYGEPGGAAVLYCHGFPACGAEAGFTEAAARATGTRVIAPDRPGFGASPPRGPRALADWPAIAAALLDTLGIAAAPVLGLSAGGPYALACGALAPARFPRLATFGALAPLNAAGATRGMSPIARLSIHLAQHHPRAQARLFRVLALPARYWTVTMSRLLTLGSPPADRAVFRDRQLRAVWTGALRGALAQGPGAAIAELRLLAAPWGFAPADVRVGVELWHGLADPVVPARHGRRLAAALPTVEARFVEAEGHFSTPVRHVEAALRRLVAEQRGAGGP